MNNIHFSSKKEIWETPQHFFDELNKYFNFQRDLAANSKNHKCDIYFTPKNDALEQNWNDFDGWSFCNPPYGRQLKKWVQKASESNSKIVMLIPARTDTSYWHDYIFGKAQIIFLKGRLKFELDGVGQDAAPFPSALVIFGNRNDKISWEGGIR